MSKPGSCLHFNHKLEKIHVPVDPKKDPIKTDIQLRKVENWLGNKTYGGMY